MTGDAVHPAFECCDRWRVLAGKLRLGNPATPGANRLGLLPSGSDPVHGVPPSQDPVINIDRTSARPTEVAPSGGDFSSA